MDERLIIESRVIMDSLRDGIYTCDKQRKIFFWSKAAERITGWRSEDVVGRTCFDGILCHEDKDGHRLCGQEHCPLHRCMVTGVSTDFPVMVFAQGKGGRRIPTQASVAPIRDAQGEIIGGVESFRDISALLIDLERARAIQAISMTHDLPADPRIAVSSHYRPHDVVGGDYWAVKSIDRDRYAVLLADAMGHGIAAGLYTIHISSLWNRHYQLLCNPAEFAATINNELVAIGKGDGSFTTGICGLIDLRRRVVELAGAGSPPALLFHADGTYEPLECSGLPFGLFKDAAYNVRRAAIAPGDSCLFFSDGATEIENAGGESLGSEGLARILQSLDYPAAGFRTDALDEKLLQYSNAIRLEDDVTFVAVDVKA